MNILVAAILMQVLWEQYPLLDTYLRTSLQLHGRGAGFLAPRSTL